MRDIKDLPERDPAKVQELANAVREMAAGMRAADVVKALASVITSVVCETSKNRETVHAIIASVHEEILLAVDRAQPPGWPPERQH